MINTRLSDSRLLKNNPLVYAGIAAIVIAVVVIAYYASIPSIPQMAKFEGDVILINPKFGATALQENDVATIQYNVRNIHIEAINNVVIKTKPKNSEDGQYIKILKNEDKIPFPIGADGTSGKREIGIEVTNVPYEGKIILIVELYVNDQFQQSKEVPVSLIQK